MYFFFFIEVVISSIIHNFFEFLKELNFFFHYLWLLDLKLYFYIGVQQKEKRIKTWRLELTFIVTLFPMFPRRYVTYEWTTLQAKKSIFTLFVWHLYVNNFSIFGARLNITSFFYYTNISTYLAGGVYILCRKSKNLR